MDPGKWSDFTDYISGIMKEGIVSRYQEEGKYILQIIKNYWIYLKKVSGYTDHVKELLRVGLKGYSWCP